MLCCPKKLVIAERYKFYCAHQEPGKDINSFAAKLKNLSKSCKFGNFLDEALRDRFVCGLRSENSKRKLLTEDNLDWEKAYQTAASVELAEGHARAMGVETMSVNKMGHSGSHFKTKNPSHKQVKTTFRYPGGSKKWKPCFRCRRKHNPEYCPAKNWECYRCNK